MKGKRSFVLFAGVLVLAVQAHHATAQTIESGQTGEGAYFQMAVPQPWNGDLVIWNHGFTLSPPAPEPSLGPLAGLMLSEGYAVAASSYQQAGWAVFKTPNDLRQLMAAFTSRFGRPRATWIYGASLGGIVTAQALEEVNLGHVVGAYTVCGALAGSRNWDGAVDLRLLYDAICEDVPGAAIPGGAEGLPKDDSIDAQEMAMRVNACTGILAPQELRTPDQTARLEKLLSAARIPESFLLTDMAYATFALRDLVHGPGKLHGKIGVGNVGVDYGDPELNNDVERVRPNRGAQRRLADNDTPDGSVGPVKIVALHTDKDGLVAVENLSAYASVVPEESLATGVVVEEVPSHCAFTPAELVAGWEVLRAWVAGGPRPSAFVLQGTCQAIEAGGLADGPCRIDPAYVVPDIDDRIRPRWPSASNARGTERARRAPYASGMR
jgi:hypothetical protein